MRREQAPRIALLAGALAIAACGTPARPAEPRPLPKAGTSLDDGSGILARASVRPPLGAPEGDGIGGAGYGGQVSGAEGGSTYGGSTYGGDSAGTGGTRYGGYQFDWSRGSTRQPISPYATDYRATGVERGGAIHGVVLWPDAPEAPALAGHGCDGAPNPTLRKSGERIAGAVVFLEDIERGRAYPASMARSLQVGGVLILEPCAMRPRVQIVSPIGAELTIHNDTPARRTVRGVPLRGGEAAFAVELDGHGASQLVTLTGAGVFHVPEDTGSGAWLVVAEHPYYTITDPAGEFRLHDVPPGRYRLTVWHAPVLTGTDQGGKPVLTAPVVTRTSVRVTAGRTTRVTARLR